MFLSHICDISNILILLADIFLKLRRTYAVLYCRPSNQSFLDKIWLVSPAQCLSIVRGTLQQYLQKNEFSAKIQMVVKTGATILNGVTSISSGMSQKQWVKCLCQVVEIINVCPINVCGI